MTTAVLAKIENLLRTSGYAELADQLVAEHPSTAPHGFVEALRAQAANMRLLGMPGTASSLEDTATRLERADTLVGALTSAWRCAREGRWL